MRAYPVSTIRINLLFWLDEAVASGSDVLGAAPPLEAAENVVRLARTLNSPDYVKPSEFPDRLLSFMYSAEVSAITLQTLPTSSSSTSPPNTSPNDPNHCGKQVVRKSPRDAMRR